MECQHCLPGGFVVTWVEVPILIGSWKLFSTAIWVCFSGRPGVTLVRKLLWDSPKNAAFFVKLVVGVSKVKNTSSHYDFIPNFPNTCYFHWAVLSDEQMRKIWPFSLLNDEQMSNKVEVKHQPVQHFEDLYFSPDGPMVLIFANPGASIIWFCRISYWQPLLVARIPWGNLCLSLFKQIQPRKKITPSPQGLMISCRSPSLKDNRWKLSITEDQPTDVPTKESNRRFQAVAVTV